MSHTSINTITDVECTVAYQWRNDHVEVLKMPVLWVSKDRGKYINKQLEVFCALSKVLSQVTNHRVKQSMKWKYKC